MSTSSNMVLIETKTVGAGGSASIDFTGIPQTGYTDLQIVLSGRSSTTDVYCTLAFNGSSANFTGRYLDGNGSSTGSGSFVPFIYTAASDYTANTFGNASIYIPNYTGSTYKSISIDTVSERNATGTAMAIIAGLWSQTAAITRVTLNHSGSGVFVEGSTASLYGIKSLNKNVGPKATGGIITTAGGYAIHTFYSSGTFTPTQDLTNVEYLVIAGGGGGGTFRGGGGGAGGYRSSVTGESSGGGASAESKLSLTSGTAYTVIVGAGGTGGSPSLNSAPGSDSTFSTITSIGGGQGSGLNTANGVRFGTSGGSGGGGAALAAGTSGYAGTANQGYAGGNANSAEEGAGGGGAGAVGQNAVSSTVAGAGGAGVSSSITGTAVTRAGGGGGATSDSGQTNGAGGAGGGGAGNYNLATAGTVNTGGGGGGAGLDAPSTSYAGNGGSGIVIVRYAL